MQTLAEEPGTRDDPLLVERFRRRDEAAFEQVVALHRRTVYRVARSLLGSHEDADDAAQAAFIRAWRARQDFRGNASLRTWLVRIVLNVAKTMKAGRAEPWILDGSALPAEAGSPLDERLEREQAGARVRGAVAALPPRQREVVVLKIFGELTHREVAAAMGLSEGAVKAHLHQAIANLRRRVAPGTEGR
ncbi:MAG TPA: RNA polymerase sigma factor [Candidatus Polarisedimenticolaceae bacterium]|nr:RNA polymerase sigma factor [Candidatus Polarisedimenticolaceae bacterium]